MDEIKSVFSSGSSDLIRECKAASHARICGGKGIRTPGLLIANETLYQLSYTPKSYSNRHLGILSSRRFALDTPPCHPVCFEHELKAQKHTATSRQGSRRPM